MDIHEAEPHASHNPAHRLCTANPEALCLLFSLQPQSISTRDTCTHSGWGKCHEGDMYHENLQECGNGRRHISLAWQWTVMPSLHLVQDSTTKVNKQKLDKGAFQGNAYYPDHLTKWCRWRGSGWSPGPPRVRRRRCPVAHGGASRVGRAQSSIERRRSPRIHTALQNTSDGYVRMPHRRTNTKPAETQKERDSTCTFSATRIHESGVRIKNSIPATEYHPKLGQLNAGG